MNNATRTTSKEYLVVWDAKAAAERHAALVAHVRLHLAAPSGEYICTCRGTRGACWYCVAREMVSG